MPVNEDVEPAYLHLFFLARAMRFCKADERYNISHEGLHTWSCELVTKPPNRSKS